MLTALNELTYTLNKEKIYRQFLQSVDTSYNQDQHDIELRELKIRVFEQASNLVKVIVQPTTSDSYDSALSSFKESMQTFIGFYTESEDHSFTARLSDGSIATLQDEEAYLAVCNELKKLHDMFTDQENRNLAISPGWAALRSTRPNL